MGMLYKFLLLIVLSIFLINPVSAVDNLDNLSSLTDFLNVDTTNNNKLLPWYTCGHYARDIVKNASQYNITLGSAIVGNHPTLLGYDNHILNYVYIQDKLVFFDAHTERLIHFHDIFYYWEYVRLYPNGEQVPTYRKYNTAPTYSFYNWSGYDEI